MNTTLTELEGVILFQSDLFADHRGRFAKTYQSELFRRCGFPFEPKESFYSVSKRNVLRGMHFQLPPEAFAKLVYCPVGRVLDVVLDLRKNSKTRGAFIARELSAENREMFLIPAGCAHGFLTLDDNSVMVYQTDKEFSPALDAGVLWNSFGFNWPVNEPVLSERDRKFPTLQNFKSPF